MINTVYRSPFPYFGGKSRIAHEVWKRFGNVPNYVEPFFGSGAVLLNREKYDPSKHTETINDMSGYVANFWRALQNDPTAVFLAANRPVNEIDLRAIHLWLVDTGKAIVEQLKEDPDFYDPCIAGRWAWGLSCWIGGGWCKESHKRYQPIFCTNSGRGVVRKDFAANPNLLYQYLEDLGKRIQRVRVSCGDWKRVVKPTVTTLNGITGIFLDPPYQEGSEICYTDNDNQEIFSVKDWAIANGDDPMLRIAVCGYEDERLTFPEHWESFAWVARKGHDKKDIGENNRFRERIWFSPHCLKPKSYEQLDIFSLIN